MKDSLAAHLDLATGFRAPGAKERATFLRRIGEYIETLGDELIQVCHEESKLPINRLRGERARTVNQLAMFADLIEEGSWVDARIDTAQPERKPIPSVTPSHLSSGGRRDCSSHSGHQHAQSNFPPADR